MMPLNRRNVLIVLGVLTIAGGALFGAGAFSQVQADRTMTANAVGDGSAYLQLDANSSYAQLDSSDELEMTLDSLNGNATTDVAYAFQITISAGNSESYEVYIDDADDAIGDSAELQFLDSEADSSITGSSNAATVSDGGTLHVTVSVDLTGDTNEASNIPPEFTIVANQQ